MTKEQTLKTNIVLAVAGLIFFVIFNSKWLLFLTFLILFITIISDKLAGLVAAAWMKFALALGFVVNKILLGLCYYLVLTPLAVLYRLFNKKMSGYFFKKSENSYYKERNEKYTPHSLENPW
jgi:predicted membrane protein